MAEMVLSSIERFWRKVADKRRQLEADALAGKLGEAAVVTAGRVEAIWISSGENDSALEFEDINGDTVRDWRPGVACMVKLKLAAQRIVEKTHRLSTPEEIQANLRQQREQKEIRDAQDRQLSQRHTIKTVQLPKE